MIRVLALCLVLCGAARAQQPLACPVPDPGSVAQQDAFWDCLHAHLVASDPLIADIAREAAQARLDMEIGLCEIAWERTPWWRRAFRYQFRNPCTHAGGR